jgi:hypothetical protein
MPRERPTSATRRRCARCKTAAAECCRACRIFGPTRNTARRTPTTCRCAATRIAEGVVLDEVAIEDIRMSALPFNMKDLALPTKCSAKWRKYRKKTCTCRFRIAENQIERCRADRFVAAGDPDFLVGTPVAADWRQARRRFPGSAHSCSGGRVWCANHRTKRGEDVALAGRTGSDQARREPLRFPCP